MVWPFNRNVQKDISPMEMQFEPSGPVWLQTPGTNFNFHKEVTAPLQNSAVAAAVMWFARSFPEAPLIVTEPMEDGEREAVDPHELSELIRRPNEFHSGTLLWMATVTDFLINGNAYWVKVRNAGGRVIALWPIAAKQMEPKGDTQISSTYISHYEYKPGGKAERLKIEDVVHFRYGIDGMNPRKGMSPLGSLLREIFTDDQAANYTAAILRNFGMPSVILMPDDPTNIPEDARAEMGREFQRKFGGDNVGGAMISSGRLRVQTVGFSPSDMDLGNIRYVPEERIAAVLGIPAAVLGLGTGLETTKVGATLKEYREQAWENAIIPTQRLLSEQIQVQLNEDFQLDQRKQRVEFDLKDVRVLQDDEDKKWERVSMAVKDGWLKVSDAQAMVGAQVDETQDGYLRNAMTTSLVESGAEPVAELPPASEPDQADDFEEEADRSAGEDGWVKHSEGGYYRGELIRPCPYGDVHKFVDGEDCKCGMSFTEPIPAGAD